jgi:hypothetical protein
MRYDAMLPRYSRSRPQLAPFDRNLPSLLPLVRRHARAAHIAVAVIVVLAGNLLARRFLRHDLGIEGAVLLEVLIVGVAVALPSTLTAIALRRPIGAIVALVGDVPPPATRLVLALVGEEVRALEMRIADLRTIGIELSTDSVSSWVRDRCFASATGAYTGTDVLVPSVFVENYGSYVLLQEEHRMRTKTQSVRINVADADELRQDRRHFPEAWAQYVKLHADAGVTLLHCDHGKALRLARDYGLGEALDLAFWAGEVVLIVHYRDDGRQAWIRMGLAPDSWYRRSSDFLRDLHLLAKPFEDTA